MSDKRNIRLDPSWLGVLEDEFSQDYMNELREFLRNESQSGKTLYPPSPLIFSAFDSTPFNEVKVVVLGHPDHVQPELISP